LGLGCVSDAFFLAAALYAEGVIELEELAPAADVSLTEFGAGAAGAAPDSISHFLLSRLGVILNVTS